MSYMMCAMCFSSNIEQYSNKTVEKIKIVQAIKQKVHKNVLAFKIIRQYIKL